MAWTFRRQEKAIHAVGTRGQGPLPGREGKLRTASSVREQEGQKERPERPKTWHECLPLLLPGFPQSCAEEAPQEEDDRIGCHSCCQLEEGLKVSEKEIPGQGREGQAE